MTEGIARAVTLVAAGVGFGCLLVIAAVAPWYVAVLAVVAAALLSAAATEVG